MKKIVTAICLAMAMLAGSVFAAEKKDIGMYGKLTIGYATITYSENDYKLDFSHFELAPAFGLTNLFPLPNFGIEGFCNLDFGGKSWGIVEFQSIMVVPGARAVWAPPISFFSGKTGTWQDQLIPYAGAGFSIPIAFYEVKSRYLDEKYNETKVYFDGEFQLGCRWAFDEHWAVLAENNFAFGGLFKYSFNAGAIYNF
ncbi:hypothetical protein MSI_9960 [Treponema sp. JC4]|uniref:hypothetical protein n=1 Tax=Treponema sp. JC4 TaxID=1124982 RepID=UPI00025B06FA|nr:hypothetical protein [Treponema sp. JC4]EID85418.1 hypothetical protein MSI_9960 [Treponema sp. JC4]